MHIPSNPQNKGNTMREEFYKQVREFGVLITQGNYFEHWMVKGCDITFTFKDTSHTLIESISL